jgi:hypothetical protein
MKLQKRFLRNYNGKDYFKFMINISPDAVEKAEFKEGDSLEAVEIKKGEIKLKRAQKP